MGPKRLSFRTMLVAGGAVLMLVPAFTAAFIYTGALQREAEQIVADSLRARGEMAAGQLARRLYTSWQMVARYALSFDPTDPGSASEEFTLLTVLDDRHSWIGVAGVDGKVVAASRGMLNGADVSQRPWFRRGLDAPFAGDVHEAVLLAKLLGKGTEPLRFIDFAAPVRDKGGAVAGVLAVHINWNWMREQLGSLEGRGIDVLLLARDRRVLFGPPALEEKTLATTASIAAGQSRGLVRVETWPDGRDYMTVVVPSVQFGDMPSFGWSLIVRQNLREALGPTRRLIRDFWTILGSAALISLALLSMGAGWLAVPLNRLADFATALSDGRTDAPPHEETRYREAAILSGALVRLQSQRMVAPVPAPTPAAKNNETG